jgi:hypothetical protein
LECFVVLGNDERHAFLDAQPGRPGPPGLSEPVWHRGGRCGGDVAVKLGLLLASVLAGAGGALALLAGGSERPARRP